ncbi:MAG: sulfite exporter TauE/SafE family protein [Desulfobacterales bacterium]
MLDIRYIWLFGLLVGLGSFSQGFTGIGFGIIPLAGIAFTPWDFERATVVLNLLLLVLNCHIIYVSRKEAPLNWKLIGTILSGEVFGVPLGYWFILAFGNQPAFRIVFGATLALLAANELFRPRIGKRLNMGFGVLAGMIGGFLSGAFTAGGPPVALFVYSRQQDSRLVKGTLQTVFLSATVWRLANIILLGEGITLPVIKVAAVNVPILLVSTFLGHAASWRISQAMFLKIVFSFIFLAGVMNILKGLQ